MSAYWVFWAIVVAGLLHVAEEYFGGFPEQMRKVIPGVTLGQFLFINALFILLSLIGVLVSRSYLVFSLSVAELLVINALIHIGATIRFKGYSPGLATAVLLYLPLAIYAYYSFLTAGELTLFDALISFLLGALWMLVVPLYQGMRLAREGRLSLKNIKF